MSVRENVRARGFIEGHVRQVMQFYHPRCIDPAGGYFGSFREDGSAFDPAHRHLVGSARMVINYAIAFQLMGDDGYREAAAYGLEFLRRSHRKPGDGYVWVLRDGVAVDATNHAYGLAFCVLAYAKAVQIGLEQAVPWLEETWEVLERRFWEPHHGLYADEADEHWRVSSYRGQNANMHLCEAWLAAYEATGQSRYLDRARLLADHMVNRQAAQCNGQIWEHYHSNWTIDWDYNKGDRSNIFRPWGLQPGHQIEWAKLLLLLDRHAPEPWRLSRARQLFDVAVETAWHAQHGGLIYGYDDRGQPYDSDKYSWVQVEAMATAALLAHRSGDASCWEWYDRIAHYSWRVFVDPVHGCWHRVRHPDNTAWDEPGCFSGLTDYHTLSACADILKVL